MVGMAKIGTSQNGWVVYDETSHFVRTQVAGVGFWSATPDVAYILDDYTLWFHNTIEKLTLPVKVFPGYDDWSYNVRSVRGQTSGYSNHSSATARDLNATLHPRGVRGSFTASQRRLMAERQMRYKDPLTGISVIRLGEFYTISPVDGMHVEINASPAAVARVVAHLKALAAQAIKEAEDDMPSAEEVAKAVWTLDIIPNKSAPAGSKNANWTGRSMISDIEDTQDQHTDTLKAHTAALKELAAGQARIEAALLKLSSPK